MYKPFKFLQKFDRGWRYPFFAGRRFSGGYLVQLWMLWPEHSDFVDRVWSWWDMESERNRNVQWLSAVHAIDWHWSMFSTEYAFRSDWAIAERDQSSEDSDWNDANQHRCLFYLTLYVCSIGCWNCTSNSLFLQFRSLNFPAHKLVSNGQAWFLGGDGPMTTYDPDFGPQFPLCPRSRPELMYGEDPVLTWPR